MTLLIQAAGIAHAHGGNQLFEDLLFEVRSGDRIALIGENGAGKSTLMKIIYGAVKPDAGEVRFDGQPVHVANPQEARQLGVAMVFQHFSLFETLSVAENVWLGLDKSLSLAEVARRVTETATAYGLEIDPARPVHTLGVGEMQRVEIIRALLAKPRLLILDEPTSVLTPQAVEKLFIVLRQLAAEGCSILYISHKLHEIRALCNACTVMRGGKVTGVCDPRQESNASLSRLMIGAEPPELDRHTRPVGDVVLRVSNLALPRESPFGVDLDGHLRGARRPGGGHRRFSQRPRPLLAPGARTSGRAGSFHIHSKQAAGAVRACRRAGARSLHFVPEERLGRGAVLDLGLVPPTCCSRARGGGHAGLVAHRPADAAGGRHHRPLRRQGRRPQAPARCSPAATCRSSSSGARSTPSPGC